MSEFETRVDSVNAICPYCGDSYQVEDEDYSEEKWVDECQSCGKKYYIHQAFYVDNHSSPDCELNGEEHKFELGKFDSGNSAFFCTVCDKCKLRE